MKIDNFDFARQVLVIAEIGNNHEGDFDVARQLVVSAADCGVNAVKFQTFKSEYYVNKADTGHIYAFGGIPGDFSGDGAVNLFDFELFIRTFSDCTNPNDDTCNQYP